MGLREYEANVVFVRQPDNFIVFDTANVYLHENCIRYEMRS